MQWDQIQTVNRSLNEQNGLPLNVPFNVKTWRTSSDTSTYFQSVRSVIVQRDCRPQNGHPVFSLVSHWSFCRIHVLVSAGLVWLHLTLSVSHWNTSFSASSSSHASFHFTSAQTFSSDLVYHLEILKISRETWSSLSALLLTPPFGYTWSDLSASFNFNIWVCWMWVSWSCAACGFYTRFFFHKRAADVPQLHLLTFLFLPNPKRRAGS